MSYLLECYFKNYTNIKNSLDLGSRYWLTKNQIMNELYIKLATRKKDDEYITDPVGLLKIMAQYLIIDLVKRDYFYIRRGHPSEWRAQGGYKLYEQTQLYEQAQLRTEYRNFVKNNAHKLGPSRAEIVKRVLYNDSQENIAKDLNIKKESVRVQLFTATKDLQEMWRKNEIKADSKQQAKLKKKGDELLLQSS